MSHSFRNRWALWCLLGMITLPLTGCMHNGLVPRTTHRQSQYRSQQLWGQNKSMSQSMAQLQQQNDQLRGNLDIANKRIDNLNAERAQMAERFKNTGRTNPLSSDANARFKGLSQKYSGITFDENTGVAKLDSDLLFDSGSDTVAKKGEALLRDIASILNSGDTKLLRVQIVGHTDDRPIAKAATKSRHPTNWHLSTNRANSVLVELKKFGIDQRRMRSSGAGEFEPIANNKDPNTRAKNRRVEIYVLAPDASDVAGAWDQVRSQN
ncbi:MAG: OmpA family protein [Planctomycetes bacterium]|nr:OmpA family protein [Planctomycetota bacterium]